MKNQTEFSEFVKAQLRQWKAIIDDLEVQVSLGKAEFKDTFEREKKNFEEFVAKQKEQLKENGKSVNMNRENLKARLDKLQEMLAMDLTADAKSFKANQAAILQAIYEIEFALKSNGIEWDFGLRMPMEMFKTKLDDFRLQLALLQFEDVASIEDAKKALEEHLKSLLARFDKRNIQEEKIDQFMDNMSSSYEHFKKAFSELFS